MFDIENEFFQTTPKFRLRVYHRDKPQFQMNELEIVHFHQKKFYILLALNYIVMMCLTKGMSFLSTTQWRGENARSLMEVWVKWVGKINRLKTNIQCGIENRLRFGFS